MCTQCMDGAERNCAEASSANPLAPCLAGRGVRWQGGFVCWRRAATVALQRRRRPWASSRRWAAARCRLPPPAAAAQTPQTRRPLHPQSGRGPGQPAAAGGRAGGRCSVRGGSHLGEGEASRSRANAQQAPCQPAATKQFIPIHPKAQRTSSTSPTPREAAAAPASTSSSSKNTPPALPSSSSSSAGAEWQAGSRTA